MPPGRTVSALASVQGEEDPFDVEAVAQRFRRAPRKRIEQILGALLAQRLLLVQGDDGHYRWLVAA